MLDSLSLRSKLLVAFIIVALIGGTVGYVGVYNIGKIENADVFLYEKVTKPLADIGEVSTHFQRMRVDTVYFMAAETAEKQADWMKKITERRADIAKNLTEFEKALVTDEERKSFGKFTDDLKKYYAAQEKAFALVGAGKSEEAKALFAGEGEGAKSRVTVQAEIEEIFKEEVDLAKNTSDGNVAAGDKAKALMIGLAIFNTVAAVGLGLLLAGSIGGSLGRISSSLKEGSTQVESASGQLTGSSQAMAEGSSESAASLEETASAMEEMSAMTKRNAESAGEAKSLSDRASHSVDKANASMETLVGRMGEISSAGEEIGKIIKTIDEIAFQTNLLALNAAVEAARAGEAGAGFAVVADEVRNLAQRAASAAKNTSDLIEGVIRKIQDGTQLVEKTSDDFSEVASSVKKVAELVGEVSAASSEQTRGISEVSSAIAQMDKVTQSNAASAEEVASASEELNAQALSLQEIVGHLETLMVGSSGGNGKASASHPSRVAPPTGRRQARAIGGGNGGARKAGGNGKALARMSKPAASKSPEDVIPLDDDDNISMF